MLRSAGPGDLGFIRSLTGRPGYAAFNGDDDEAVLRARLANPDERVLIWQGGDRRGFAIFRGLTGTGGIVELFRIALDQPGGGAGDAFFRALVDHAFHDFKASRLWLDANAENARAVKVYTRAGFRL